MCQIQLLANMKSSKELFLGNERILASNLFNEEASVQWNTTQVGNRKVFNIIDLYEIVKAIQEKKKFCCSYFYKLACRNLPILIVIIALQLSLETKRCVPLKSSYKKVFVGAIIEHRMIPTKPNYLANCQSSCQSATAHHKALPHSNKKCWIVSNLLQKHSLQQFQFVLAKLSWVITTPLLKYNINILSLRGNFKCQISHVTLTPLLTK